MDNNYRNKLISPMVIILLVVILLAAFLVILQLSVSIAANNSSDKPASISFSPSTASTLFSMPVLTTSTERIPLDNTKTWYTEEEILNAFGPAPSAISGATTQVLLAKNGIVFPYPNGTRAYCTEFAGAQDPTTEELIAFLATDDTYRQHDLVPGKFVCVNFAVLLNDRAESRGIKAYMASIMFTSGPESGTNHMINAFNTTDAGWVYVDAMDTGWILIGRLVPGEKYMGTLMKNQDGKWGFFLAETGNTVGGVEIV